MKNVTPSPGQVWEHKKTNMSCMLNEVNIDYNDPVSLHKHFTFQPQNDLEWLAVNVNGVDVSSFYAKDTSSRDGYKVNGEDLIRNYGGKLVQSKQIELGLDEPQQRETKMIDLSDAKVGDDFVDGVGCKFKLMVIGKNDAVLSGYNCNGELYHYTSNFDGRFSDDDTILVSKHDPRHWLKGLPDADIFEGEWLACETYDCEWYLYQGEPKMSGDGTHFGTNGMFALGPLMGIKMPKLTGDEWKLSKISIPDLKAWQEQQVK